MNKTLLHTVIIYTLIKCPYCIEAKKILDENKIVYQEIIVDDFSQEEKAKVGNKTIKDGKVITTFPHILKSMGGCSDLQVLKETGKLDQLQDKKADD